MAIISASPTPAESSSVVAGDRGGEEQKGGPTKEQEEPFGRDVSDHHDWVMVSWLYTNVKTYQIICFQKYVQRTLRQLFLDKAI